MDDAVELADLIGELRSELSRAMWAGEHADIRFEPKSVELELTVGIDRTGGREGKIRFWVLDASMKSDRKSITTQRIKLTLEPRLAAQPTRSPLISGESMATER